MIIAGHRGFGCTDHDFYQDKRDIANLPVENTLASIEAAFKAGAQYIETDALMSADGVLFTLHNVVPKDHFFGAEKPNAMLNTLPFSEIEKYKTGRSENGVVAKLSDVLELCAQYSTPSCPFDINIEIKGVQGSGQSYEDNEYLEKLAELVMQSNVPTERVLFSSFSLKNITQMSHLLPSAQYGMLFSEHEAKKPSIYANHQDDFSYQYIPFNGGDIDTILSIWQKDAASNATLEYLNPEIATITESKIDICAQKGLGINCWGLFEDLDEARQETYINLAKQCADRGVFLSCITDYCDTMVALAKNLPAHNTPS